jgi:hypothetical protein
VDGERSIAKQVGLYYDEWTPQYRAVFRYTFVNVNCFFAQPIPFGNVIAVEAGRRRVMARSAHRGPVRLAFTPVGSPSNPYDRSLVEAFRRGLRRVGLIENQRRLEQELSPSYSYRLT